MFGVKVRLARRALQVEPVARDMSGLRGEDCAPVHHVRLFAPGPAVRLCPG